MKLRLKIFMLLALLVCLPISAKFNFEIADIRIEGLMRVSSGTVFNSISMDVGDTANQFTVRLLIEELFATGYFEDITVSRDGDILIVSIVERPAIDSIDITGNKAIPTEALLEGLSEQGLREGEIFQQATLDRVRIELVRQYVAQGQYTANITTDITNLSRNRVAIAITVEEGKSAGIKQIAFVGNEVFDNKTLLGVMELKQPKLFGFLTGEHRYSREKLQGDLESIDSYYRDRGYVKFKIETTQVSMTPDRKEVYVTIAVNEGEKHNIRGVELVGDLDDVNPEFLERLILVKPDQVYSNALITSSEERLVAALGTFGYTFATASGIPEIHDDGSVDIKFLVNTGKRAYVRRLNFAGNTVTQDSVLRREMRQMEGGWASTDQIELSKQRLERLGYFSEVTVETPAVEGEEGLVDVDFALTEQATGAITGSLGYQKFGGLIVGAGIQKANVAGTGKNLAFSLNWSDYRKSLSYTYTNPYYTEEGVSRGLSLFIRDTNYDSFNLNSFSTSAIGGGAIFGIPIGETRKLQMSTRFELTDIQESRREAREISEFIGSEGSKFLNYKFELLWAMNTQNRFMFATRGTKQNIALEFAVPPSDLSFYRVSYRGERYFPVIGPDWAIRLRTAIGYGGVYGDTDRYPFYEHFYAGGFSSVRGFERHSLGPRSTPVGSLAGSGRPYGGNVLTEFSTEFVFPLPFIEQIGQVRSVMFVDAGNVFNSDCPESSFNCFEPDVGELRYSVGVGVSWNTRMGPMSFSLSKAFNTNENDEVEAFSFELGQYF